MGNVSHKAKKTGVPIFASLHATTRRVIITFANSCTSKDFLHHLYRVKEYFGKGRLYVITDGHGAHTAKRTQRLAAKKGSHLAVLPAHSPDLNPTEEVWRQRKLALANRVFFTIEELTEAISQSFQERDYTFTIAIESYYKEEETFENF